MALANIVVAGLMAYHAMRTGRLVVLWLSVAAIVVMIALLAIPLLPSQQRCITCRFHQAMWTFLAIALTNTMVGVMLAHATLRLPGRACGVLVWAGILLVAAMLALLAIPLVSGSRATVHIMTLMQRCWYG